MCWIGLPKDQRPPLSGCDRTDENAPEWAPKSGNYDATNPAVVDLLQALWDSLRNSGGYTNTP